METETGKRERGVGVVLGVPTSVQAAGQQVPLAGGALEMWRGPVDQGAGLPGLGLRTAAIAELGAHHQKTFRGRFWRHQPGGGREG